MSVQVVDSVENLFDGEINLNQPLDWEFLGEARCRPWSRWESFRTGECVSLPNGETWCARRNVAPGEVGPGERGWKHAWDLRSTMLGADDAAEAAYAQRHHGRNGFPLVGALVADFQSLKQEAREGDTMESSDSIVRATDDMRRLLMHAADAKVPAVPAAQVVPYDEMDEISFDPVQLEILGGDLDGKNFPVTEGLYRRFVGKREPKFMRLDTEASYRDFRAAQSPEIAALRRKVEALEALVLAHGADGHGAEDILVGLASDVAVLRSEMERKRVPLQMPPWMEGTWDCWREEGPDGGLVCCSIALPGHDGNVWICTTAAPVKPHVENVVGYAESVGADVANLLGALPTIACMLAGGSLMTEVAAAAPVVLAHPRARGDRPFIGKIVPANQPTMATLMALLQTAQGGSAQAKREWESLSKAAETKADLRESMIEAKRRLLAAQVDLLGWAKR